jgi:hypothetical protein
MVLRERALHVSDIRITTADITRASYGGGHDAALYFMTTETHLEATKAYWRTQAVLTCVLHAVRRRFQRAEPAARNDEAVLADLRTLAAALPELAKMADGDAFSVVAGAGEWLGEIGSLITPGDEPKIVPHVRAWWE